MSESDSEVMQAVKDYVAMSQAVIAKLTADGRTADDTKGLLSHTGQLQDMQGRPIGLVRRKRKPALDHNRALTPSQRAKVYETGKRNSAMPASAQPVQKSIEEMLADRARLDVEMKALAPEAIIDAKIAASGLRKVSMTWLDEAPDVEVIESGPWFNRRIRIH